MSKVTITGTKRSGASFVERIESSQLSERLELLCKRGCEATARAFDGADVGGVWVNEGKRVWVSDEDYDA